MRPSSDAGGDHPVGSGRADADPGVLLLPVRDHRQAGGQVGVELGLGRGEVLGQHVVGGRRDGGGGRVGAVTLPFAGGVVDRERGEGQVERPDRRGAARPRCRWCGPRSAARPPRPTRRAGPRAGAAPAEAAGPARGTATRGMSRTDAVAATARRRDGMAGTFRARTSRSRSVGSGRRAAAIRVSANLSSRRRRSALRACLGSETSATSGGLVAAGGRGVCWGA